MKKLVIVGLLIFNGVLICGMGLRDNPTETSFRIINPVANVQYIVATTEVPEKPEEPEELTTEELIIRESTAAGIDPSVAVAISRLETGHWTSDAYIYHNNVGGLSDNEVPRSYPTIEDGVKAFVECLVTYWEKGLTTPELIEPVYCPPSDGEWAAKVRAFMGGM